MIRVKIVVLQVLNYTHVSIKGNNNLCVNMFKIICKKGRNKE